MHCILCKLFFLIRHLPSDTHFPDLVYIDVLGRHTHTHTLIFAYQFVKHWLVQIIFLKFSTQNVLLENCDRMHFKLNLPSSTSSTMSGSQMYPGSLIWHKSGFSNGFGYVFKDQAWFVRVSASSIISPLMMATLSQSRQITMKLICIDWLIILIEERDDQVFEMKKTLVQFNFHRYIKFIFQLAVQSNNQKKLIKNEMCL